MTIEQTKPRSVYTIATTGPYALRDSGGNPWPYVADGLTVSVIKDGVITDLIGAGWFTVSPASGTNGNLTLTAAALAAYAGAQLVIMRETPIEQAWQATQGPREVGLAVQLDRLAMGLQDQAADASGALRLANQTVPPAALTSGHVVLFEGGKFVDGPAPGEIINAAANAQIATTKAAEASASATTAANSAALSQTLSNQFGALYLGPKTTAPTTDNLGGAIQNGAIYLNTTNSTVFFRIAGVWQATSLANLGITVSAAQINNVGSVTATAAQINSLATPIPAHFLAGDTTINRAPAGYDPSNPAAWRIAPLTQNGVTLTNIGYGRDVDGIPYVDISIVGTTTTNAVMPFGYLAGAARTPAVTGEVWTASCYAQRIGGVAAGEGLLQFLLGENMPAGTYISQSTATFNSATRGVVSCTYTVPAGANTVQVYTNFRYPAGTVLNEVFRISGLQLDRAAARMAYPLKSLSPAEARTVLQVQGYGNLIRNGTGRVNQRGYVSGAATSANFEFTLDGWYVRVAGQNMTFAGTVAGYILTAPAGGVSQVIEAGDVIGGTYCLSWVGNATATVNGVSVANGGLVTLTGGQSVVISFFGGTFTQAQLELGGLRSPYQQRSLVDELRACQRYYSTVMVHAQSPAVGAFLVPWFAPVPMRATPTLTVIAAGTSSNATALQDYVADGSGGYLQINATANSGFVTFRRYGLTAELTA